MHVTQFVAQFVTHGLSGKLAHPAFLTRRTWGRGSDDEDRLDKLRTSSIGRKTCTDAYIPYPSNYLCTYYLCRHCTPRSPLPVPCQYNRFGRQKPAATTLPWTPDDSAASTSRPTASVSVDSASHGCMSEAMSSSWSSCPSST